MKQRTEKGPAIVIIGRTVLIAIIPIVLTILLVLLALFVTVIYFPKLE